MNVVCCNLTLHLCLLQFPFLSSLSAHNMDELILERSSCSIDFFLFVIFRIVRNFRKKREWKVTRFVECYGPESGCGICRGWLTDIPCAAINLNSHCPRGGVSWSDQHARASSPASTCCKVSALHLNMRFYRSSPAPRPPSRRPSLSFSLPHSWLM